MSKPNVHQKTILNLLSDTKADFLIPDYQRPYAWNQDQCQTLWDDLVNFTIPGGNHEKFDSKGRIFPWLDRSLSRERKTRNN